MHSVLPVRISDTALAGELARGMALVEEQLLDVVRTREAVLADASRHLIEAGGKRLRPFLVLVAARFGDPQDPRVLPSAVAVELMHIGTLYHDDVMDGAEVRRGVPSPNAVWGNSIAVLTGDYLLARASRIIADLGDEAVRIHARTFGQLIDGQWAETAGPKNGTDLFGHYFGVLANKTASLFGSSGELGARLAGASDEITACVRRACEAWGMAYQLSDDVLDVTSESDQAGKAPGTDLRQGVATFPILQVRRSARAQDARLVELLGSGQLTDPGLHAEALGLLREHPAMDAARDEVRKWASAARDEITTLPGSPARDGFEALCDFVADSIS